LFQIGAAFASKASPCMSSRLVESTQSITLPMVRWRSACSKIQ
jgi:hypothetical protein